MELVLISEFVSFDQWLAEELVKTYPIVNELEWELSRVKGYNDDTPLHFISVIENPSCDPWGRTLIPWTYEYANVEMEWEKLHGGVKLLLDNPEPQAYYRYTTVAKKPACLYRYDPTN